MEIAASPVPLKSVLAASLLTVIGAACFLGTPVILAAAVGDLVLSETQVGVLGSALLSGSAISAVMSAFLVRRYRWSLLAFMALLVEASGFLAASVVDTFPAILLPIWLASFGGGALYSLAMTVLSDHPQAVRLFGCSAVRLFGFAISVQVAFQVLMLLSMPWFMVPGGLADCLYALLGLCVIGACLIHLLPAQSAGSTNLDTMSVAEVLNQPKALLCLMACLVFFISIGAVWAYLERLGTLSGFAAVQLSQVLAGGVAISILGSITAVWQGSRYGDLLPLGGASAGMLAAVVMLQVPMSMMQFFVAFAIYNFFWNYSLSYQYAAVARIDSSGRYVAATPAFHSIGGAVGPLIAAVFVTSEQLIAVNVVAGIALLISFTLFYMALSTRRHT